MVFGHSLLSSTQECGDISCDNSTQRSKTSGGLTFVIGYCESDVLWDNAVLLHEAGQDTGLLQHLGHQVLKYCCQVDWGQFSDPGNIWYMVKVSSNRSRYCLFLTCYAATSPCDKFCGSCQQGTANQLWQIEISFWPSCIPVVKEEAWSAVNVNV